MAAGLSLLGWVAAQAGTPPQPRDMSGGWVVSACGADALTAGQQGVLELTPDGRLCVSLSAGGALGTVGVTSLPALPAGSNGIGTVGVTALPVLPAGTNNIGSVNTPAAGTITNPGNAITRPANTTNYAQNNLIASSVTAGSVVVSSFSLLNSGGVIPRVRLFTNKTSGWDGVVIRVRLWQSAPTYTNGDGGAYAVATNAFGLLGAYDVTLSQFGDAATGIAAPNNGTAAWIKVPGTAVFWDLQYLGSAALTPASGQTFTMVAEIAN